MTKIINNTATEAELDQELIELIEKNLSRRNYVTRRPKGFGVSVDEYLGAMEKSKKIVSKDYVRKELNDLVKNGILEKKMVQDTENSMRRYLIYYKVGTWPKD